jgi:hypothetical protein
MFTNGPIPDDMLIDHRCHTHLCCNPRHLRLATNKQNMENRRGVASHSSSGIRGVGKRKNGWQATVRHHGKRVCVGLFATAEEAGAAARAKRIELFTHNDRDREMSCPP